MTYGLLGYRVGPYKGSHLSYNGGMPLYEYVCKACEHPFEALVYASTRPQCPVCQSRSLAKQLSVFAVAGRGSALPEAQLSGPCGSCGDPRGPGACSTED